MPLDRQSKIFAREKVDLHRSTLTDWVGRSTALLEPLADHIGKLVRAGPALFADDTPVKLQSKLKPKKTQTARLWSYVRNEGPWCVEALQEAIAKYGPPEICNTDQGSQFTGSAWITALTAAGVRISMYGRGRYLDNILIERLWRSLKQEAIYLEGISDGFEARRVVKNWMTFYNTERPHSALYRQTPDEAYWAVLEKQKAA